LNPRLFTGHELAFRTQYAELKERALAAGPLLPGTPGSLSLRSGTGHSYWYRVYYPVPGKQWEDLVCKEGDDATLAAMQERMAFAAWAAAQVSSLKKLSFQVADKTTARVLVELHNTKAFDAGLVLVGTLAHMALLNELGAIAVAARTLDVDLARRQKLRLGMPLPFMKTMIATGLPFAAVPGPPSTSPSTSVKLKGAQGLRVDVLAPGKVLGATVKVPELQWAAQAVPFYDYLLEAAGPGAMLAGGHCVPVRLPEAGRFVWHKLYSSTQRRGFPEKAAKDRQQALVIGAALVEFEAGALALAFSAAPRSMVAPLRQHAAMLANEARAHPELVDALRGCLAPATRPKKKTRVAR
jgi:hypothetical protein